MNARVRGTREECQQFVEALQRTAVLEVTSVSEPRKDRPPSELYRVYVGLRPKRADEKGS